MPWWAWAAAGIALVQLFGFRSITVGAKVLGGLLIAETGILVLLAVAVLIQGGADGLSLASFAPSNITVPGAGGVLALAGDLRRAGHHERRRRDPGQHHRHWLTTR